MNEEEELTVREVLARLTKKTFDVNSYEIVAQARGHEIIWYQDYGSYQGTWVMLSRYVDKYYIWKDSYGSCSGCDALQGTDLPEDDFPAIWKFANEYTPFAICPVDVALDLISRNELGTIFPANERDWQLDDCSTEDVIKLMGEKIIENTRKK